MSLRFAKRVMTALLLAAALFGLPASGSAVLLRAVQVISASPQAGRHTVANVVEPQPTPPLSASASKQTAPPNRESIADSGISRWQFQRPPPSVFLA